MRRTVQGVVPAHAPDQAVRLEPSPGAAPSFTAVPSGNVAEHAVRAAPQSIPAGVEVTLPLPTTVTFKVCTELPPPPLPAGYWFIPWDESLLEAHAEAKYLSFRLEIDANVFPCLGELHGCQRLMSGPRCGGSSATPNLFLSGRPGAFILISSYFALGHGIGNRAEALHE